MNKYLHIRAFLHTLAQWLPLEKPIYEFVLDRFAGNLLREHPEQIASGSILAGGGFGRFQEDRLWQLSRLPFADSVAQTVFCIHVLEYQPDPLGTIREMQRILAPGGVLVIVSGGAGGLGDPFPWTDLKYIESQEFAADREQLWTCSPAGLTRVLADWPAVCLAWQGPAQCAQTLYAVAKKSPAEEDFLQRLAQFCQVLPDQFRQNQPIPPTSHRPFWQWLGGWKWWKRLRCGLPGEHPAQEISVAYTFSFQRQGCPPARCGHRIRLE